MPVYILHGFRWPRPLIRIHIILQNLDDAAAEWLVAPATTDALLDNFNELMPETMRHLAHLRFVEQYDPNDISATAASQPYAYVADVVEEVKLGMDLDDVRGSGLGREQSEAITELRDRLAPEAKLAWYVVFCGDETRSVPPSEFGEEEDTSYDTPNTSETKSAVDTGFANEVMNAVVDTTNRYTPPTIVENVENIEAAKRPAPESRPRGLSKLFNSYRSNRLGKKKSFIFSRFGDSSSQSSTATPPVPAIKRPQTSTGHA